MRISKINLYTPQVSYSLNCNKGAKKPYISNVSFGESEWTGGAPVHSSKEPSFVQKIFHKKPKEIKFNPEEAKSEDIKRDLTGMNKLAKELRSNGRACCIHARAVLAAGRADNYNGYSVYDNKKHLKVVYAKDDKTGAITKATVVKIGGGEFSTQEVIYFYNDSIFAVEDFSNKNYDTLTTICDKKIINWEKTKKHSGEFTEVIPRKHGFLYTEGEKAPEGIIIEIKKEADIDYGDPNHINKYTETRAHGKDYYEHNMKTGMWEKVTKQDQSE